MSEVEAKLAQVFDKLQGLVLKDDNVVGQLLRKLGEVQSKVDTVADNSTDVSFSQLQDEMAALNLDEATKAELLNAIGTVDTAGAPSSDSISHFVEDVFAKLRNLQGLFTGSNVDVNAVTAELSKTFEQVKAHAQPVLGGLNLNGSDILATVQKLIGSQLR